MTQKLTVKNMDGKPISNFEELVKHFMKDKAVILILSTEFNERLKEDKKVLRITDENNKLVLS